MDKKGTSEDMLRFWWFEDEESKKPMPSLIQAHIFWAKWSPTMGTFALRHHGKVMSGQLSPEAAEAIIRPFYVDNLLVSVDETIDT